MDGWTYIDTHKHIHIQHTHVHYISNIRIQTDISVYISDSFHIPTYLWNSILLDRNTKLFGTPFISNGLKITETTPSASLKASDQKLLHTEYTMTLELLIY